MKSLALKPMAIGSLPYDNAENALDYVFESFPNTPFWPQLGHVSRYEDMVVQYMQGMPGICLDEKDGKLFFDMDSESFFDELEAFYLDYDEIVSAKNYDNLHKYAVTRPFSSTVESFFSRLKLVKPEFAKGQITGPFTWGTSVTDKDGKCAFYDETLKDIIVKTLTLKAVWQVVEIKKASTESVPVIFLDEPAISQCGTSAFITVETADIKDSLAEITSVLKELGSVVGVHCCGKADWGMILDADVDVINLDAYFFAQNLSIFHEKVQKFLSKGGYIAWGVVPTLDKVALESADAGVIAEKFEEAVEFLLKKGLNKELVLSRSFVTPSCGAGSLDLELAKKAMTLTKELSLLLNERYQNLVRSK